MVHVSRHPARRRFLQQFASISALAGTPFAANLAMMGAASAQTHGDYKALVCVFLFGGNDHANLIVPRSGSAYTDYFNARPSLALSQASLRAINPVGYTGGALGLHPAMSNVQSMINGGRCAVVANVGTLVTPTSFTQWNDGEPTVAVPPQLFSHADQQNQWQTGLPDRGSATGWMGRMGDVTAPLYNPNSGVSICMSIGGNNMIQAGEDTIQYQITNQGAIAVQGLAPSSSGLYGSKMSQQALRRLLTDSRAGMMEAEWARIGKRSVDTESIVTNALAAAPLVTTTFPGSGIGNQLRMVARMIAAGGQLSQRRQVFFVSQGGYDFHDNLVQEQNERLGELDAALGAFNTAMNALGTQNFVTTFTASDFGRALRHNGRGSDHGWGGHQFVFGGAVQGNRMFGTFPTIAFGTDTDVGNGRLLPTTSVDEFAVTLARWFGVTDTLALDTILPNRNRFMMGTQGMGFL
ncbi:MAG: DUF1501 domain-containing protein [Betaproteobacteria bacterium]|nr:MAG: DUF1501 domain-containing protein [Betaproteobacteria bacterium]